MRRPNSHPRSDKGIPKYTDVEIVERNSISEPNSGCWLWIGNVNSCGYGRLGGARIERSAHRLSYTAFRGEIPPGMRVLHRCDVRCCVNPAHLFLGTDADNMRDMAAKGRGYVTRGEDHAMAKLTSEAVGEIRASKQTSAELARRYGVSHKTIRLVRGGVTWSR